MTPADFEALPRFAFEVESVSALTARVVTAVMMVLLPALLLALWGASRLRVVALSEQ